MIDAALLAPQRTLQLAFASMREPMQRLVAALSTSENPHLLKPIRAEVRRGRPLLAVGGMFTALALTCALSFAIWHWLPDVTTAALIARGWNPLRAALMACTGVQVLIITIVVSTRSQRFFIQEATQNTLEQLLLTPAEAPELMLQISMHNFVYGMLLALVGLPFYTVWLAMGDLTGWQLLGMYLLFARMSFSVPSPRLFVAQWRLRQQRGQQTKEERKRQRQQAIPAAIAGFSSVFIQILAQVCMRWIGPRYGAALMNLFFKVWAILPAQLQHLAPSFVFSWFYLWVVLMTSPLAWYRLHIAPLILFLPFMMLGRWLVIVRAALFIQQNIPVMTTPASSAPPAHVPTHVDTHLSRRLAELEALGAFGFSLTLLGYLWNPLVQSGTVSWLVSRSRSDLAHALAALVLWYGILALFTSLTYWRDALTR